MARPRQPIDLIAAKGKKHLTKAEIEERRATEVRPCSDDIKAPAYLTAAQKRRFDQLADQLTKLGIMGETDTDTLARYIAAQSLYEQATKRLRSALTRTDVTPAELGQLTKMQDRYFKQAQTAASSLGLTITSRCGLVAPKAPEEPKRNKFAKFGDDEEAEDE